MSGVEKAICIRADRRTSEKVFGEDRTLLDFFPSLRMRAHD